jgi:lipopolysaccharide biosynthesis regulator YciM
MKKMLLQLLLLAGLMAWGPAGCSNKEIDTAKLQTAFQSAPEGVRADLDQGIAAIKDGKFPEALKDLQKVAFEAKMSPEQRLTLEDAIKKVKARAK